MTPQEAPYVAWIVLELAYARNVLGYRNRNIPWRSSSGYHWWSLGRYFRSLGFVPATRFEQKRSMTKMKLYWPKWLDSLADNKHNIEYLSKTFWHWYFEPYWFWIHTLFFFWGGGVVFTKSRKFTPPRFSGALILCLNIYFCWSISVGFSSERLLSNPKHSAYWSEC